MADELIRWTGYLDGPRSFRGGNFYGSVDVKSHLIRGQSAVMASVSQADEAGEPVLGEVVIIVGAVVPYDGGAHVQIGTDSLEQGPVRLAVTLMVSQSACSR
jgi:hypothetical protein